MGLITTEMLKTTFDPKVSITMSQYVKALVDTKIETLNEVLEMINERIEALEAGNGAKELLIGYTALCEEIEEVKNGYNSASM